MPCLSIVFEYWIYVVYLIKIQLLIYKSYKRHFELYTKIHRPIAANARKIQLARKAIILLSDKAVMFYKVG